jgi:outer membrane protein OmpA-like peptidoglycan-associated protein
MNGTTRIPWRAQLRAATIAGCGAALLAACAQTPETPIEVAATRAELSQLQADAALAPLVAQELTEAEAAVQLAEQDADAALTAHRVYLAQREIEIARAVGEARLAEQERQALVDEREQARLQARTREAESARMEADAARMAAASAQQQAVQLQQEIAALHAQETERGLVLTLGDVLFETGRAELKPGAVLDLDRLVDFLDKYPQRTALVEGHTDSVGGEDYNRHLSQSRADAVRAYLVRQGVPASRITASGMGESAPVASNNTEAGRQQNRRVEIVISEHGSASSR